MALEDLLIRQMPHSLEGEQAVLGSMLIDAGCVKDVMDKLRPGDFYLRQNREIFETIYSMFSYAKPIDGIKGKVQNMGLQYAIGGVMDCNIIDIADVLIRANKGFEPRLTQADVESFLESDSTDIEELSERILGFFKSANATKKVTLSLIEVVEKEKAKQTANETA